MRQSETTSSRLWRSLVGLGLLFALLVGYAPCAPVHATAASGPAAMHAMPCCLPAHTVAAPMLCCATHSQPAEQLAESFTPAAPPAECAYHHSVGAFPTPALVSQSSAVRPPPPPLLRTPLRI